jgi:nucleoside-diphosphate-sugar epimerase
LLRSGSQTEGLKKLLHHLSGDNKLYEQIKWFDGDVLDVPSLEAAIESADHIYHCAAVVSYNKRRRTEMYRVNVEGTTNVVNTAIQKQGISLCHISSIAALGRKANHDVLDEHAEWQHSELNTHYGITKNLSENEVWRGMEEGLDALIVNPGLIVGPGDPSRSSIAIFEKLHSGFSYYPDGSTGMISARDCAAFCIQEMELKRFGERTVAVSEEIVLKELFDWICEALGRNAANKKPSNVEMQFARYAEWIKQLITGKDALVTKETLMNSKLNFHYNNQKFQERFSNPQTIRSAVLDTVNFLRAAYGWN